MSLTTQSVARGDGLQERQRQARHNVILCLNVVIGALAPIPFGIAFLLPLAAGLFLTSGTQWFRIAVVTASFALVGIGVGTGLISTLA